MYPRITGRIALRSLLAVALLSSCRDDPSSPPPSGTAPALTPARGTAAGEFTRDFEIERCSFATEGQNRYLVLIPGHTLRLEDGAGGRLTITVLDQTERVGGVRTRVVEERHEENGELVEVSRNYFAICREHNSVFYFGEAVDNYENGVVVDHNGSWRHGERRAQAGLQMPGLPLLGSRYYQEIAPGSALDRAEIIALDRRMRTRAGAFDDVLVTLESTPLEPGLLEEKSYAPGIGLLKDGDLLLVAVRSRGRGDD